MHLLLVFILAITAVCSQTVTTDNEPNVADIAQRIIDIEHQLEQEVQNAIANKKQESADKKAAREQKAKELKDRFEQAKASIEAKINDYKAKKAEFDAAVNATRQEKLDEFNQLVNEIRTVNEAVKEQKEELKKQAYDKLVADLTEAYNTKKAEKEQADAEKKAKYEQAKQELQQKFEEMKTKFQQAAEDKKAEQQTKLDQIKAALADLNAVVNAELEERKQNKEQRTAEQNQKFEAIKNEIKAQQNSLDAEAEALQIKYDEYEKKKDELADTVKRAFQEAAKTSFKNKVEDSLQSALDKEAAKRVANEIKNGAAAGDAKSPVAKASLFDEISGKSAWQTVTWILLALCILLSVALIAMILYQVSQRNKYQRLDGYDQHERTPLAQPISQAHALPYHTEKTPLQSSSSAAAPPQQTASAPSTAPPVYPHETQQF